MALFGLLLPCSRHQVYHHHHLVVCILELRHVSFWYMIDLRMTTRTMRRKRVRYLNLILVIERLDHFQGSPDKRNVRTVESGIISYRRSNQHHMIRHWNESRNILPRHCSYIQIETPCPGWLPEIEVSLTEIDRIRKNRPKITLLWIKNSASNPK